MATALIAGGTSLLSGILGKSGASKAAKAQTEALNAAMAQQSQQFQQTRSDMMPFMSAGGPALASIQDLLGLSGADPQAAAIAALKASPGFTSLFNTGADTILQNSAATGGLRGGNTNMSLAGFGSGLLSTVIQNQLQSLGGLASMGAGAAGQMGAFGQNNSNAMSQLFAQQGTAKANGIAGQYGAMQSALQGIGGAAGNYFGSLPSSSSMINLSAMPGLGGMSHETAGHRW